VREKCDAIYPPIVWRSAVYEKDGKSCVKVEIEHSGNAPHFAGAAWIRKGSESIKASEEMLQKLITLRTSKNRELQKWLGKQVTATWVKEGDFQMVPKMNRVYKDIKLAALTEFYVTFETVDQSSRKSEPLNVLTLSWDDSEDRLRIFISAV
jgi:predicted HTH transcriptional regulator